MIAKLFLISTLLAFSACHRKSVPMHGVCQKDKDCQHGVCFLNKCQECAIDTDCLQSQICEKHQCITKLASTPTCLTSSDCDAGLVCSSGVCAETAPHAAVASCSGIIHFAFNQYALDTDSRDSLAEMASCIRENPEQNFIIAGNTDDRGTVEYNLALGEKRAQVVAGYLKNSGINDSRMRVISYGKEKPVDFANNEEAWAKNRRTDITLDN